ncbi:pentatricopeptide repeat-containing protein [Tanacetum coccineum]
MKLSVPPMDSLEIETLRYLISIYAHRFRGDVTSVKLFYHDMIRRGFSLDTVTYNIRIESYSKQGISHYTTKAQELFDEIRDRYLVPDSGVYNALINAYIRSGNVMSATRVINEMEENNILPDHVTFHTMFYRVNKITSGIKRCFTPLSPKDQLKLVPETQRSNVMTLCLQNHEVNEALVWRYLMKELLSA